MNIYSSLALPHGMLLSRLNFCLFLASAWKLLPRRRSIYNTAPAARTISEASTSCFRCIEIDATPGSCRRRRTGRDWPARALGLGNIKIVAWGWTVCSAALFALLYVSSEVSCSTILCSGTDTLCCTDDMEALTPWRIKHAPVTLSAALYWPADQIFFG